MAPPAPCVPCNQFWSCNQFWGLGGAGRDQLRFYYFFFSLCVRRGRGGPHPEVLKGCFQLTVCHRYSRDPAVLGIGSRPPPYKAYTWLIELSPEPQSWSFTIRLFLPILAYISWRNPWGLSLQCSGNRAGLGMEVRIPAYEVCSVCWTISLTSPLLLLFW